MNWKRLPLYIAYASVWTFVIFALGNLGNWRGGFTHLSSQLFFKGTCMVIALSLGIFGFEELDHGGRRKVNRILYICFIILMIPLFLCTINTMTAEWSVLAAIGV